MTNKYLKILVVLAFLSVVAVFYFYRLDQYLTLESIKSEQSQLENLYSRYPAITVFTYFLTYVLVAATSLPGATILTLLGGALFGFSVALLIVSFASTLGATLAFLSARFLFRETVQTRFSEKLIAVNSGIRSDGNYYLLTLRLMPIFPFFIVNLVMGLTPISTFTFYLFSQIGMLPGTAIYINAGTQLAKIESLRDILSPQLLISFLLVGAFPILIRKIVKTAKERRNAKKI